MRSGSRALLPFLFLLLSSSAEGRPAPQAGPPRDLPEIHIPAAGFWERLEYLFLPESLQHVYRLRRFITGEEFPSLCRPLQPRERVDAVYLSAVKITDGDPIEALLVSCFATLPYRTFDAVIPFVRWVVTIPVSTESRENFLRRLRNLPAGFLRDSPPHGDQDKLPHFFGSAYLACVTRSPAMATRVGVWVEALESVFKLEGFSDPRDLWANERGAEFAMALLAHRDVLPSDILHPPETIRR